MWCTLAKIKLFYIDHTEVTLKQYKKTHPKHDQSYLPEKDIIYDNSLIKKDLNVEFTGLDESFRTTYSWLTKNPKNLNYFSESYPNTNYWLENLQNSDLLVSL